MNKEQHTENFEAKKDRILFALAPILANNYSSLLNSEEAYTIALDITIYLDKIIATHLSKKRSAG